MQSSSWQKYSDDTDEEDREINVRLLNIIMIDVPKSLKKTKSFRCSVRDYIRKVVKGKKNYFVAVLGLLIKGYSKKNSEDLSVVKFRMILLGFQGY